MRWFRTGAVRANLIFTQERAALFVSCYGPEDNQRAILDENGKLLRGSTFPRSATTRASDDVSSRIISIGLVHRKLRLTRMASLRSANSSRVGITWKPTLLLGGRVTGPAKNRAYTRILSGLAHIGDGETALHWRGRATQNRISIKACTDVFR